LYFISIHFPNIFLKVSEIKFLKSIFLEIQQEIQTCSGNVFNYAVFGILTVIKTWDYNIQSEFESFFTPDKFKGILIETSNRMNREGKNTIYFYLRLFNVTDKIGLPLSEIIVDREYNIKVPLNHTSTSYWLSNRDDEIGCLKQFIDIVKTNNIKITLHFNQDKISVFRSIDLLTRNILLSS